MTDRRCLFAGAHDHSVCVAAYARADREAAAPTDRARFLDEVEDLFRTFVAEFTPVAEPRDARLLAIAAETLDVVAGLRE